MNKRENDCERGIERERAKQRASGHGTSEEFRERK